MIVLIFSEKNSIFLVLCNKSNLEYPKMLKMGGRRNPQGVEEQKKTQGGGQRNLQRGNGEMQTIGY